MYPSSRPRLKKKLESDALIFYEFDPKRLHEICTSMIFFHVYCRVQVVKKLKAWFHLAAAARQTMTLRGRDFALSLLSNLAPRLLLLQWDRYLVWFWNQKKNTVGVQQLYLKRLLLGNRKTLTTQVSCSNKSILVFNGTCYSTASGSHIFVAKLLMVWIICLITKVVESQNLKLTRWPRKPFVIPSHAHR